MDENILLGGILLIAIVGLVIIGKQIKKTARPTRIVRMDDETEYDTFFIGGRR